MFDPIQSRNTLPAVVPQPLSGTPTSLSRSHQEPQSVTLGIQTEDSSSEEELRPRKKPKLATRNASTQAFYDEELIARRWLKRNGYYMAKHSDLTMRLFHHFMSVAKLPRGRADKAGSQQAQISMDIPSKPAAMAMLKELPYMGNTKYTINSKGQIEWVKTSSIQSWYVDEMKQLARWIRFHRRGLHAHAYGATKIVPPTGGYKEANVVVTLIPPLICELCERSHGRLVLEITCNVMTLNEHGLPKLPPNFPYTPATAETFIAEMRHAIYEMKLRGTPLSTSMCDLVTEPDMLLDWESQDESDLEDETDPTDPDWDGRS